MVEELCHRPWCLANGCETRGCAEARSGLGSVDMACVKNNKRTCPDDRTCCMAASDIPVEQHVVIDSVKAKKALKCVENIVALAKEYRAGPTGNGQLLIQGAMEFVIADLKIHGFFEEKKEEPRSHVCPHGYPCDIHG